MRTKITELLEIEYPIICGGMLHLCKPELAAAISNAGGLGNITACNYDSGEELREAIHECRKLTNKPFNVNITLLPSLRVPAERFDEYFTVCAEERVPAIEVGGKPATQYLPMLHAAGVKVFHKVGSVRHALNIERLGYDGIFAAGFEEGGHPLNDDVTTMVLTPRIVESVNIPVVTTGGIADGRGLAAALALGAEGVMMATRFIATTEAQPLVHENFIKEIVSHQECDTTIISKKGTQGRSLKNATTVKIHELEESNASREELYPYITGQKTKAAYVTGDVEDCTFLIGQSIGLINDIVSCQTLLDGMVSEAKDILLKQVARFAN